MNVMRNFTLRSLKRNKKRTAVTIVGVAISAAMITAVTVFVASLVGFIQRGTIADGGNWHAEIRGVEARNIGVIRDSGDVQTAVLSRDLGYAFLEGSEPGHKQYLYLRQYGAGGFDQMSVRLISGRLPERSGEVLVSSYLAEEKADYTAGSSVTLKIGDIVLAGGDKVKGNDYIPYEYDDDGNIINEPVFTPRRTESFNVVGVMDAPGLERSWSSAYAVLGYIDESSLAPSDSVDVYVTVPSVSRSIYDDMTALAERAGAAGGTYNNDLLRYYGIVMEDNVYSFLQGFMAVIILIIMVASISLIYNAFAISVAERSKQLGLLASVGATKRQKRASVYYEGFFIGIIGVPLGILAGIAGMAITLAAIQPVLESLFTVALGVKLTLVAPPLALAASVTLSAVTIFISAWIPARRASKIMPIDAIRMTREVKLTRKAVRTSGAIRALFGFEAEIALKNLKRSRKRYRSTILSLVISLVLFLTVSMYASITARLSGASYEGYNYDIAVYYSGASETEKQLDGKIAQLGHVKEYTASYSLNGFVSIEAGQLSDVANDYLEMQTGMPLGAKIDFMASMIALDDAAFAKYAQEAGLNAADFADAQSPKAILINYGQSNVFFGNNVKKAAGEILSVSAGETLTFTAGDPEMQSPSGSDAALTVGALTDKRPMGVLVGGLSTAAFVVTDDVWNAVVKGFSAERLKQLSDISAINNTSYITADDDQKLEKQILELAQGHGVNVFNIKSAARAEQNMQLFLGVFVYGFIILISLICIANIFNTVSTNIALRRREFAMLRSVGMTPKSFGKMIRFESIFYGIKGLLYGIPISVAVAFLLFNMQRSVMSSEFTLPWVSYGFAVLMILVIVSATMLYSTSKIKRENILDALKEETT